MSTLSKLCFLLELHKFSLYNQSQNCCQCLLQVLISTIQKIKRILEKKPISSIFRVEFSLNMRQTESTIVFDLNGLNALSNNFNENKRKNQLTNKCRRFLRNRFLSLNQAIFSPQFHQSHYQLQLFFCSHFNTTYKRTMAKSNINKLLSSWT